MTELWERCPDQQGLVCSPQMRGNKFQHGGVEPHNLLLRLERWFDLLPAIPCSVVELAAAKPVLYLIGRMQTGIAVGQHFAHQGVVLPASQAPLVGRRRIDY